MALHIELLDTLHIEQDGQPSSLLNSPKAMALLVCLLIDYRARSREFLADLLWDAQSTSDALRNLRALLYRLRKIIPQVKAEGSYLFFEAEPRDTVDLFSLLEGLESQDPQQMDQALQHYKGDLLRDFYLLDGTRFNEWLTIEREHLRRRVLQAYAILCQRYQGEQAWPAGVAAARRWLALDPFDEAAHYWLVRFLAASGQRRRALGQYQRYRQMLMEQFDLLPAPKMVTLHEEIRAAGEIGAGEGEKRAVPPARLALGPDWGTAPDTTAFFGREAELKQLETWVLEDTCPLIFVLGMGGQGKTALAAQLTRSLADEFDGVIWRSLLNAPLPGELLSELLDYLCQCQIHDPTESIHVQLAVLRKYLKRGRFLMVLDNLESVLQDQNPGQYHPEYTDYGRILQLFGSSHHQSTLLITSREKPKGLERDAFQTRSLPLAGLLTAAGREMLTYAGLSGADAQLAQLVARYSGNPLALKLVIRAIQDLYGGSITAFLQDETAIFEDIRAVLDRQFQRLTSVEQEILFWLAIERESVTLNTLQARLLSSPRQRRLLEAVYDLQRRSWLEKNPGQVFGLQNVIIEYLTDRLVEQIAWEIRHTAPNYVSRYALQPAQGHDYVRLSQARRILDPIAKCLLSQSDPKEIETDFKRLLGHLRSLAKRTQGYAAGNVLNLLLHLDIDPAAYDFSRLAVWQVNLQDRELPGVNFADADLSGSVFTELFGLVYAVAYSPNGQMLAAGTGNGKLYIWWTVTGQLALMLQAHAESVWGLAFSPDSRTLASSGADGNIRLWDAYSGELVTVVGEHTDGAPALTFSPDGRTLVSAGSTGQVCVWDAQTGGLKQRLGGHSASVQAVVFSPDGTWLATGARDHRIQLWQIGTLAEQESARSACTLLGHTDWVNALAFSPDGRTLVSAGNEGVIYLWHHRNGRLRQKLKGHAGGIQALAFSPDGRLLASGSNDHSVRLWDGQTGQLRHTFLGHSNWVRALSFSPDGRTLATGGWDHSVRLWDIHKHRALRSYHGIRRWVFGLTFSADGRTLISASADRKVRLWDVASGAPQRTLSGHTDWVWNVALTPDETVLISSSMDRSLRLWDVASGASLAVLREHRDGLQSLACSPDGRLLASGDLEQTIILWDIVDANHGQVTMRGELSGHQGWCLGLHFSPDGRTLASSSADHTIRLWDVESRACRRILDKHTDGVQQVFFSPDGRLLASASWDKSAILWDAVTGEMLRRLQGHTGILRALAFSPDGRQLATGGNDQTVRIWDVRSGDLQQEIAAHDNWVFYLAFSPDGRILASASSDETIKLWDAATGALRHRWQIPGPYAGMSIIGATGLSAAQRADLEALGAET
jgi:WD40 repeat protein/DNA-binding SARP family transcriptional activator